jgi:hypothetical protein
MEVPPPRDKARMFDEVQVSDVSNRMRHQRFFLKGNGNKVGTNAVANHFKRRDEFVVQFAGMKKRFVHAGIGGFFLRDFAHRAILFEAGADVTLVAFAVPEERCGVENIAPDVVLFDQYKSGFRWTHG